MHPNSAFRHDDRALLESLLDEIGFGMVFAPTPDGPRVAHVPLLWTGDGAVHVVDLVSVITTLTTTPVTRTEGKET